MLTKGLDWEHHYIGSASLNVFRADDAEELITVVASSTSNWSYGLHSASSIKRQSAYGSSDNPEKENSTINNIWIWSIPLDATRLK